MTWATVYGPGRDGSGFARRIVDSDFPWLVKACYHEAGTGNPFEWGAVLWTLTNRWAGKYGRTGETLGQYAQRFCQPINPAQIGVVHSYDRTSEDPTGLVASRARDARIRANRARPVACYFTGGSSCGGVRAAPDLVDYVLRFMRGEVWDRRYVGLTDWAAPYAGHGAEDIPVSLPVEGNTFYRETWTAGWDAGTVSMSGAASTSPLRAGLGLLGGILVAGLGVGLLVWHRRHTHNMRLGGSRGLM